MVTRATKELFERRAQEYQKKGKLDEARRKKWNKTIRNACRNDYRHWVATWVQKIEDADNKGNTKEIYRGVKALSGASQHSTTRPTMHWKQTDLKEKPKETHGRASNSPQTRASPTPTRKVTEPQTRASDAPAQKVASGERISGPDELAKVWQDFLAEKFTATEKEKLRAEFDALPDNNEEDQITSEEFKDAVSHMRKGKATGPDNIPSEVWQNSTVAQEALFEFLKEVWRKERVPAELALGIFVMIYKNKGSQDDCSKYRAIGLLNHAYKILSVILLRRLERECAKFFTD